MLYELYGDTNTDSVLRPYRVDSEYRISAAACSPDDSHLLLGCDGGKLFVFDLASDATEPVFIQTHNKNISAVAWSSNDVIAYGGNEFTRIFLWRQATSSDSPSPDHVELQDGECACTLLSFSPDGAWLAAGSYSDGVIYVYDVQTRVCLRKISLLIWQSGPKVLSFSSNGTKIYTEYDTCDVSDLRELPSSPDAGTVSREVPGQRRTYRFDGDDKRWIVDQNGKRACRLPPLNEPNMKPHGDKVAVWDDDGRFLVLRMK